MIGRHFALLMILVSIAYAAMLLVVMLWDFSTVEWVCAEDTFGQTDCKWVR